MFLKPLEEKKTNKFLDFLKNHPAVIIAVVLAVIVLFAFIFYRENSDTGKKEVKFGASNSTYQNTDTILLASHQIESLNPLSSTDSDTYQITQLVYSSLFSLDENLNVQTDLADSYQTDPDAGTVTITLRSGVVFSDGSALDESDVAYTVRQIKSIGDQGPYYVYADRIDRVSGSGTKVTIYFKDPSDAALDNLTFPIVSSSGYSKDDSYTPLGSGPYKIESVKKNFSVIKLTPNESFYGSKAKNNITFSQVTYDGNLTGLVSEGKITAYINQTDPDAKSEAADLGIHGAYFRSNQCEYLGFRYSGATKKKKVRRAICYALDTASLAKDSYGSSAMLSDSIYYPGFLGTKNSKDAFPYDQSKAEDLLRDAGYYDRDGDGKIENSKGKAMTLSLLVNSDNSRRTDCATEIKDELASAGITVKVVKKSGEEYDAAVSEHNFDLLLAGYQFDKTYNLKEMFDTGNDLGYTNRVVKRKAAALETSLTAGEQTKAYRQLKKSLNSEVPYYCICYKRWTLVYPDGLSKQDKPRFYDWYYGISSWNWNEVVTPDTASDTYESSTK